jgi:hypothetical protein
MHTVGYRVLDEEAELGWRSGALLVVPEEEGVSGSGPRQRQRSKHETHSNTVTYWGFDVFADADMEETDKDAVCARATCGGDENESELGFLLTSSRAPSPHP